MIGLGPARTTSPPGHRVANTLRLHDDEANTNKIANRRPGCIPRKKQMKTVYAFFCFIVIRIIIAIFIAIAENT